MVCLVTTFSPSVWTQRSKGVGGTRAERSLVMCFSIVGGWGAAPLRTAGRSDAGESACR